MITYGGFQKTVLNGNDYLVGEDLAVQGFPPKRQGFPSQVVIKQTTLRSENVLR